jgi:hypothetical protein
LRVNINAFARSKSTKTWGELLPQEGRHSNTEVVRTASEAFLQNVDSKVALRLIPERDVRPLRRMRAPVTRDDERKPRSLQGQANELGLARLIGFNDSRRTRSEIPRVGVHSGDSGFRGNLDLHRHLAVAEEGEKRSSSLEARS